MTANAGSRPTAAFSATLEVELAHVPGTLGRLCMAIGDVGGNIQSLDGFTITKARCVSTSWWTPPAKPTWTRSAPPSTASMAST